MFGYLLPVMALVMAAPDSDTKKTVVSAQGVLITVLVDDFSQDNVYISPDITISDSDDNIFGTAYLVVQRKRGLTTNYSFTTMVSRAVSGSGFEPISVSSASFRGGDDVRLIRTNPRTTSFSINDLELKRHSLNEAVDIKLYLEGGGSSVIRIPKSHFDGITEVASKP